MMSRGVDEAASRNRLPEGQIGRFSAEKRNADQADRGRFGRIGLLVGIDPRQSALIRWIRVSCFGLSNGRHKDGGQPVWVSRR